MITSGTRERENGTFDQLLVTPLTPPEILIGKAVPPILIGLVQATLMLCIAVFWFKIQLVDYLFDFVMVLVTNHMHGICVAEEIVHIAENFLVSADEKHT